MPSQLNDVTKGLSTKWWKVATKYLTNQMTTDFIDQRNPTGMAWRMDRPSERPWALGYLKLPGFVRWCQSEQGIQVLGVDISRAGVGSAEREGEIRRFISDLFALCVHYSKICVEPGQMRGEDYEIVASARSFKEGTFCLYQGFAHALHSTEFRELKEKWVQLGIKKPPAAASSSSSTPSHKPAPKPSTGVYMDGPDEDFAWKKAANGATETSGYTSPKPTTASAGPLGEEFEKPIDTDTLLAQAKDIMEKMAESHAHYQMREENTGPLRDSWTDFPPSPEPEEPEPEEPEPEEPEPEEHKPEEHKPEEHKPKATWPRGKPIKARKPAPLKRKRGTDPTEAQGTKDWPAGSIGFDVMRAYDAIKTKAKDKTLVFGPNSKGVLQARDPAMGDAFTPMVQPRKEGKEGAWDAYVEVGGAAADAQVGKRTRSALLLRSSQDIIRFFNANPHLNLVVGEA